MKLPSAKGANIVVQEAGSELLIYNLTTNKAYNLNETASIVFNACGSQSSFDELKDRHNYTDDLIYLTLFELKKNDLIEGEAGNHYPQMSRREAAKRVGLATMIALPVIASIVAPSAAHAASACTPGDSSGDPNGNLGSGERCDCGSGANEGNLQLCNTSRGGGGGSGRVCKVGCICRTNSVNDCIRNGYCIGTCG